ncbi:hypothetical protein EV188_101899 [Actinomycetospora succinea]|uniref:Uncharacterized protein n=1 Tax=Actinomycetospora succinea TaxID=663603 RepID=A0A4R6VSM9_9PSEU|nr:hypothetical protein [Actinomycetospora succinea]TDQ65647.1 hypothetical protein EV188_101899 [Actinomycetospora succinea]
MLVLAPDPRLGIAPERVARVRALLEEAERSTPVPGVAVALPGGPDGPLDGLVLRPDGVLGLAALPVGEREAARQSVAAGGGPAPSAPSTGARGDGPTARAVLDELDRLLSLGDPPCAAPRRVLPSVGEEADTCAALAAPVGSFRVVDVADLRRLLVAFRLGDHVPDDDRLAEAGFLAPDTPALRAGAAPETTPVPVQDSGSQPEGRAGLPRTGRLPASAPESSGPPVGPVGPVSSVSSASSASEPPGGIGGLARAGRAARAARGRYGRRMPAWVWGWRGLTVAAVAAFLVALGLAVLVGRAAVGTDPPADPAATRVVDGVTYTRQVATSDTSCEGHAYNQAAAFLRERGCLHLDRSLWSGNAEGQEVVVAVATVQLADTSTATAFRSLVDSNGTGNVSDLLREGRGYPGAPPALSGQGYASAQLGDRVAVAEADGIDPDFTDGEALDRISRAGLALR